MPDITAEAVVILLLLVANGFLALSEIAVVSARRPRLQHRAERGDAAARAAVALAESPWSPPARPPACSIPSNGGS